jgi:ribosomal protein S18 acetylase RimI-like enzyme
MPEIEVRPLSESDLDAAAALLGERHARHRESEPLLAEVDDYRALVEEAWRAENASGWVAVGEGEVTGYLIGAPGSREWWGPNVWVGAAGHAAREPEVIRDLYGVAAGSWVEAGNTRHYVLVPASEAGLIDAWWRLSFGHQHSHAIQELPARVDTKVPDGLEIRDPDPDEIEALIDIDLALPEHQRRSPVFGGRGDPPDREESRVEWLETLAGDEEKILIGALNGRAVACWAFVDPNRSSQHHTLLAPEGASFLGFASTLPEARGSGIGVALTNAGLAWASEEGHTAMTTDWRETNLLASRFWPARGFRRTFLRLYRSIP